MKKLFLLLIALLFLTTPVQALQKNIASQTVCAQLVAVADGSAVTSGTTDVYYIGDNGIQTDTAIDATHKGYGTWCFTPSQAQTNYTHVAYTFVNPSAINVAVQIYTKGYDPTLAALPANVTQWLGDAVNEQQNGYPAVTIKDGTGIGEIDTASGAIVNVDSVDLTTTTTTATTCTSVTNDVGITQAGADKVWGTATRLLTAGTNIALAKGTGVTGFNDITAANVWDTNISAYSGAGYAGTYLKILYDKRPATGSMLDDATWTGAKAGYLDVAISSRGTSTFAIGQDVGTASTCTTLTNWDKTGYSIADSTSDAVIADAVWNAATASYGGAGSYGLLLETDLDTNIGSRGTSTLTASDNIGINWADVAAPTTSVNLSGTTISTSQNIGTATTCTTATTCEALGATAKTDVNAEVDTALSDIGLNHLLAASVTGTDVTDNSIIAKIVSKLVTADWDSFNNTTDSLEAIADGAVSGGATAQEVWEYAINGCLTANWACTYLKSLFDNQDWNPWDAGTRTLTAIDEDNTFIDIDSSTIGTCTSVTNDVNLLDATEAQIDTIETKIKRIVP